MTTSVEHKTLDTDDEAAEAEPARRGRLRLPTGRRGRALTAALLVALLGLGAGGYFWYQHTALPDDAAFRVGDQVVTVDQLNTKVETLRALYGVQVPREPGKLAAFRKDTAKAAAVGIILDRAARAERVVVADKVAREALAAFTAQQFGEGEQARESFIQSLGAVGTSEAAVLSEIKRQLTVNKLFNEVTAKVSVSDGEVTRAFARRRAQLGTPERRTIANIVVADQDQARQLLRQLDEGAPFAALARANSLDRSTSDQGGSLGELSRGDLEPGYGKAAFTAQRGAPFGPVRTRFGWNVGRVTGIKAAVPAELTKVKDSLAKQLELEKATKLWRSWLSRRIREADVEYADEYRPADPDAAPPVGQSAPGGKPVPR